MFFLNSQIDKKPSSTSGKAGGTLAGAFNDKMPFCKVLFYQDKTKKKKKKNDEMRNGIGFFYKMLVFTFIS